MKKFLNTEEKEFLEMNVTVVDKEWIVVNDMFKALGYERENYSKYIGKVVDLTNVLDNVSHKIEGGKTFPPLGDSINTEVSASDTQQNNLFKILPIKQKQGKRNVITYIKCIKLDVVPIILIQFKPTARRGEEALKTWERFMRFVYDLLKSLEVYKFIVTDKQNQLSDMERLDSLQGNPIIANQMINKIMGELILHGQEDKFPITKDMLRYYQDQTTSVFEKI